MICSATSSLVPSQMLITAFYCIQRFVNYVGNLMSPDPTRPPSFVTSASGIKKRPDTNLASTGITMGSRTPISRPVEIKRIGRLRMTG